MEYFFAFPYNIRLEKKSYLFKLLTKNIFYCSYILKNYITILFDFVTKDAAKPPYSFISPEIFHFFVTYNCAKFQGM
jgi:hypothetical protein